jgi:16S rRNA processing protein RimM
VVAPRDLALEPPAPGDSYWMRGAWRSVTACRVEPKGRWVIRIADVGDRDDADAMRGTELIVEAADLPELEDDRFYIHDLVGCLLEDPEGNPLGQVIAVAPGAQDQLEIEHEDVRFLIPMVRDWLRTIDLEQQRIVIDAPPGLIEATRG